VKVCAGVIVVLVGVRGGDCEGIDAVDVCGVAGDGALHPDTKSRKITKKAKIGRTFINGYSGSHNPWVMDTGYSMMIMIISSFLYRMHSPITRKKRQQNASMRL
jgi:hypothetical protein